MDLTPEALATAAGLLAWTFVVTQIIKIMLGKDGAVQDRLIPLIAVPVGIVGAFLGDLIVADTVIRSVPQAIAYDVVAGVIAAAAVVGGYTIGKRAIGQ